MHWVEISRAVGAKDAPLSDHTKRQMEAYSRVLRGGPGRAARGRDLPRRAPRRVRRLLVARLPARARHGPLDRHDDDRVPEDRRGRRVRARRGHGLLDAPARHRRQRRLPLHAGHVARHGDAAASRWRPCRWRSTSSRSAVGKIAGEPSCVGHEVGGHREVAPQLLGRARAVARRRTPRGCARARAGARARCRGSGRRARGSARCCPTSGGSAARASRSPRLCRA